MKKEPQRKERTAVRRKHTAIKKVNIPEALSNWKKLFVSRTRDDERR